VFEHFRCVFFIIQLLEYPVSCTLGGKSVRRSLFSRSKSMVSISYHPVTANGEMLVNSVNNSQGINKLLPRVIYNHVSAELSHRGIKVNNILCVQETPLKKQVPNYQQFKLQRTR